MAQRRQWLEVPSKTYLVLWWIRARTTPDAMAALARLEILYRQGPSAEAVTLARVFQAPSPAE